MHSKDAILPVSYFPSVSYLSLFNRLNVTVEIYENYQRRTFRNKCRIMSANGMSDLVVPLRKGKTNLNVKDVLIAYDEDWVNNHLRTIRSSYGTAPYFEYYFEEIESILKAKPEYLLELSLSILEFLANKKIIDSYKTSTCYITNEDYKGYDGRIIKDIKADEFEIYQQVFEHKYGFVSNLSILDILFNTGPECRYIIDKSVFL